MAPGPGRRQGLVGLEGEVMSRGGARASRAREESFDPPLRVSVIGGEIEEIIESVLRERLNRPGDEFVVYLALAALNAINLACRNAHGPG